MSRDKVMAMLWPEKDEEQARHLLSVAVYEIRKELGEEVLESRGDDLTLAAPALTTDVEALDAAIEGGDLETAVSLYEGPFLDGVHLGGSPELEEWVARTRETRARTFRRAMEGLAEERERAGDLPGAVEAWRRLAGQDRYNSRVALRLLRALERVGNPAGALQFARVHAALLEEEFGTEPPAEFTAAVASLRDAPAERPSPDPVPEESEQAGRTAPAEMAQPEEAEEAVEARSTAEAAAPAGTMETVAAGPGEGSEATSSGRESGRKWRRGLREGGAVWSPRILVLLALVAGGAALGELLEGRGATAPVRIAVLPFEPVLEDERDQAYGEGLAESVLHALAGVEGVEVTSRGAAFSLRGAGTREAARQLGVDYVLGGSLQREGDRLRIRVELSGADGVMKWWHKYDRSDGNYFATQDQIARNVLSALEVELTGEALSRPEGETRNAEARQAYERGRSAFFKRTPEGFRQALIYYGKAVEVDPGYARAFAGLADVYNLVGAFDYGVMHPDSAYPRAREAALRARELAPELAEAHAALGNTLFAYERDWAGAEAAYRRAIALNPHYPEAHHWYALFLIATGRPAQAIAEARSALALDSLSEVMRTSMGRQLYFRGRYREALAYYESVLATSPQFLTASHGWALVQIQLGRPLEAAETLEEALDGMGSDRPAVTLGLLGHALAVAGQGDRARGLLSELQEMEGAGRYVPPEYPAMIRLGLGDREGALDDLEEAFRDNSSSVAFLGVEPLVASLRGHPRYERLRERVGLP